VTTTIGQERRPILGRRELTDPPFGGRPAFVSSPLLSARPVLVDLTRPDLTHPQ
jgi:hypothetical protein